MATRTIQMKFSYIKMMKNYCVFGCVWCFHVKMSLKIPSFFVFIVPTTINQTVWENDVLYLIWTVMWKCACVSVMLFAWLVTLILFLFLLLFNKYRHYNMWNGDRIHSSFHFKFSFLNTSTMFLFIIFC